ncbi:membrane-bound PQQ-dependent dehydrogenase, glucose/quinate/shikimate family [Acinetobacter sp. MD2(2019)]|uniref:membrane-bound PQQ-dependent dehydrogenase, glucose/quinate/shikimate family n=1 Tax=Acinetobacter sp. MD2(2019) TaxID=2605273 RepID=UPI002D1F32BF|nr:membrane-bound PQQ-dependent dehydrogenase, glucose/quinate/shikimate family [Acinetobacter sp. MD2(2019)]MEB3753933.1 membrane-bound PQQ-dependent dehydrogenase, glucose/quinate/shikimate family [Acinetobacter sp. MD2(2019)]
MEVSPTPRGIIPIRIFAALLLLLALPLLFGGAYLAILGGSWYYLFAGIILSASSGFLFKNNLMGAKLFGVFFVVTLIWTIYETGSRFWGWVPRLALVAVFAFFLTLLLPYIGRGVSRKISYSLTAVIGAAFVVTGICAFLPHNSYESGQALSDKPLVGAVTDPTQADSDWTHYGRDSNATRYSPLQLINTDNVKELKQAWVYRTGDLPPAGKDNKWAAEHTPIKVGNGLYVCSATNNISRIDPATGKEVWKFKSGVEYKSVPYTAACRGLTYYESKVIPRGQACHSRILVGTLDMRLIAVDTETGKTCEGFGTHGQTDLNTGMGPVTPGFTAVTAPVVVVNDTVITNQEVRDNQRRWAPSGVIRGYDAETGKFKWAWDVKRPNDHSEPKDGQEYSRGTPNSWTAMVGDDKLGLIYVPMGNAAADHYSALRSPEEEKVNAAVVALDAKTGDLRWSFQTVHKDVWDQDLGSQPTLMDYPDNTGKAVPAMLVPTKLGQTFILNRITGKPLTRVEEKAVPTTGGVKDDPRSPTQPFSVEIPRLGANFGDLNETKMWGISPIDQMMCRIKYRQANYQGIDTPPSLDKPWIMYPGNNGGSDWGSYAYDGNRGLLIANWNNTPMYAQLLSRKEADKEGLKSMDDPNYKSVGGAGRPMADTPYGVKITAFFSSTGMLCSEPPYGMITAIDLHTKSILWQHPLGSAERNGPFNIATHMPINIGTPNNGGPIITAGGLTFVAATTDDKIRAFDNRTGKELWSAVLPAGGQATPMTYSINGEQYLVIMAGGHHFMKTPVGDYLVAFKLPSNK